MVTFFAGLGVCVLAVGFATAAGWLARVLRACICLGVYTHTHAMTRVQYVCVWCVWCVCVRAVSQSIKRPFITMYERVCAFAVLSLLLSLIYGI